MRHFTRTILFSRSTGDRSGYIPPLGTFSADFVVPERDFPTTYRLRLSGEPDYYWKWRTEGGSPYSIAMAADDALNSEDTFHERFSLEFRCRKDDCFPRNIYVKIFPGDLVPGAAYTFSIPVKTRGFTLAADGEAGAFLEIYHAKEGRHPKDIHDQPDEIIRLDFPHGTTPWTLLERQFTLSQNAVCILVRIGANGAEGTALIGSPRLDTPGKDSVIPFLARTQEKDCTLNYLGENLSRRDWLECRVDIDGQEIFNGEKYTSIVRRPEFTFHAGSLAPGRHTFTLTLQNDFENAVGFIPLSLELHELGCHDFELAGLPETVQEGKEYGALLQINKPGVVVTAAGRSKAFPTPGLHGMLLPPLQTAGEEVIFHCESFEDSAFVERVPREENPPIYLGTGDAVYIPQTIEDMDIFLEWYVASHIGNCICFRHAYRWGGGRGLNMDLWRHTTALLQELGLHYTLMVDGREVPGMKSNPPDAVMTSPLYLGRRSHENDGAFCYWGTVVFSSFPEPFGDILCRGIDPGGIQPNVRPTRVNGKTYFFYDPDHPGNVKDMAEYFVANLRKSAGDSTRHSGPSALFRYFFQAGYKVLLAEQMYGPEEIILCALRGASRAYNAPEFGTHLALQWGSKPHDTREHAERYFLSLATSYLHGASEINTEEGLWRMEAQFVDYDRFSHNCQLHQEAHHRFRKFLEHHPRNGKMVVPIACLQGRYDGWRCFGRSAVWCMNAPEWQFGPAEESFDLLKLFYPRCKLGMVYANNCPDAPQGWYSGSPYGPIDIAPVETDWTTYAAVAFLGWHSYLPGDDEKMLKYVLQGGTLLLSKKHLSISLNRNEYQPAPSTPALEKLLGAAWQDESQGIVRRNVGKGTVCYFPKNAWPAEASVRGEYEKALQGIAQKATASEALQKGWIEANEDVEFTAYDQTDGTRVFYLLNIRWWDRKNAVVHLQQGKIIREIDVPYGEIMVVT